MIDHFIFRALVLSGAATLPCVLLSLWLGGDVSAIAQTALEVGR